MKRRFEQLWQELNINKKILLFTAAVVVACVLSVILNIWVVKFSFVDFGVILQENTQSVNLVQALEKEQSQFRDLIQQQNGVTYEIFKKTASKTKEALDGLPYDYSEIGEERYSMTWSIRNSYEVYAQERDAFITAGKSNPSYINDLYRIYDMQEYVLSYAKNLMTDTLEVGTGKYQEKISGLVWVPAIVLVAAILLLSVIIFMARLMNRTIIVPVMRLADSAKKIADNDFYVEDVQVENKDELGDLVHAFNKMKYATGEYITALEEKRKTLDLLHSEELKKLEAENRLEAIRFELLKSQVNPHFLFNTLNVIGGMANLEDAQTTEKMIKSLSSLFRYNLKTDDIEVPLMRELKVVEDYMYLQKMRFGERITYGIECHADKERSMVPAFTFQPLVENAIIHGLSKKEEGGNVRIRIRRRKDNLYIYIGDTGKGMSLRVLEEVRTNLEQLKTGETYRGIGLGNIYRRVHSMYPDGKMRIYSKENTGTVVIVVIPQRIEEIHVSDNSSR